MQEEERIVTGILPLECAGRGRRILLPAELPCGWYSNKARGLRRKQAEAAATASGEPAAPAPIRSRASQTWALLIKRVYESTHCSVLVVQAR